MSTEIQKNNPDLNEDFEQQVQSSLEELKNASTQAPPTGLKDMSKPQEVNKLVGELQAQMMRLDTKLDQYKHSASQLATHIYDIEDALEACRVAHDKLVSPDTTVHRPRKY